MTIKDNRIRLVGKVQIPALPGNKNIIRNASVMYKNIINNHDLNTGLRLFPTPQTSLCAYEIMTQISFRNFLHLVAGPGETYSLALKVSLTQNQIVAALNHDIRHRLIPEYDYRRPRVSNYFLLRLGSLIYRVVFYYNDGSYYSIIHINDHPFQLTDFDKKIRGPNEWQGGQPCIRAAGPHRVIIPQVN